MKKKGDGISRKENSKIFRGVINIFFVVVLIISCLVYIAIMFKKTNDQYMIRLQETGDELAKNIDSRLEMEIRYLSGVAECFSNYEDIHCVEAIDTLIRVGEHGYFTRMWLTKVDGVAISSELKESDATGREYLERAKKGESGISKVQTSRVNGEKNVVLFAPTYYNGEVTGMVIGILKLDSFFDIINVDCFGGQGYCNIHTSDGEILVSTDSRYDESVLESKYGYSVSLGILDWNIFVSFPEQVINGEIRDNMVITIVMCLICAVVLGVIIINTFRERNHMLKEKASQDSLTSLLNRGTIEQTVEEYVNTRRDHDSAFLIFDIDKFKMINDSMGHSLGDFLLKQVGVEMKKVFGEADCLCRMGGDEFAIFIREVRDKDDLLHKAETFREKIERIPLKKDSKSTVSIGIVFVKGDSGKTTFDAIYQKADKAMYMSKSQGGNRITVL